MSRGGFRKVSGFPGFRARVLVAKGGLGFRVGREDSRLKVGRLRIRKCSQQVPVKARALKQTRETLLKPSPPSPTLNPNRRPKSPPQTPKQPKPQAQKVLDTQNKAKPKKKQKTE